MTTDTAPKRKGGPKDIPANVGVTPKANDGDAAGQAREPSAAALRADYEAKNRLAELATNGHSEHEARPASVRPPMINDVLLSDIVVLPDRMRKLREEVVDQLAESMKVQGLLQPILLRRAKGHDFYLVAGKHRYFAAKNLGWDAIQARIAAGMDADRALLAEIDENLVRAGLLSAEEAEHDKARKEVYQRLYPETKKGGDRRSNARRSKRKDCALKDTYTEDVAKKTGKSRRSIEMAVSRGEKIPNVAELAGTSLDKGVELDALAQAPPDQRDELIADAKAGKQVSAKQAMAAIAGEKVSAVPIFTHDLFADQVRKVVEICMAAGDKAKVPPDLPRERAREFLQLIDGARSALNVLRKGLREIVVDDGEPEEEQAAARH